MRVKHKGFGSHEQTEKETKAEEAKTTGAARPLATARLLGHDDQEVKREANDADSKQC